MSVSFICYHILWFNFGHGFDHRVHTYTYTYIHTLLTPCFCNFTAVVSGVQPLPEALTSEADFSCQRLHQFD